MAARETQGLQIALIVFVVLTLALAVSTFMFFQKREEERGRIAEAETKATDANKGRVDAEDLTKKVKEVLGVAAGDGLEAIDKMKKADFEAYGATVPADQQNYRTLVKQLHGMLVQKEERIKDGEQSEKKLTDNLATVQTTKVEENTTYKGSVDKTAEDLAAERDKFVKELATLTTTKEDIAKKLDSKRKEFDDSNKKLRAEIEELQATVKKQQAVIDRFIEDNKKDEEDLEVADGLINWVNQGERLVWINVGAEDGLRQQVTFKVFSAEDTNPATAKSKGEIEVIRVNDSHMAQARILSDKLTNPIQPGDKIFSGAWHPGRIESFALRSFMDIDGDGDSDRELIKRLIKRSGGRIDVELTDEGKLEGELQVGTTYVIEGDRTADLKLTDEYIKNYGKLETQITKMGIRHLPVKKFLDYIGYKPDSRTVALGTKANMRDFRAPKSQVPRKSIGKPIDYSPIVPKPKPPTR